LAQRKWTFQPRLRAIDRGRRNKGNWKRLQRYGAPRKVLPKIAGFWQKITGFAP
jgi:hypothetical protein